MLSPLAYGNSLCLYVFMSCRPHSDYSETDVHRLRAFSECDGWVYAGMLGERGLGLAAHFLSGDFVKITTP